VVLTLHQPRAEVFECIDRTMVLNHGRLVHYGRKQDTVAFIKEIYGNQLGDTDDEGEVGDEGDGDTIASTNSTVPEDDTIDPAEKIDIDADIDADSDVDSTTNYSMEQRESADKLAGINIPSNRAAQMIALITNHTGPAPGRVKEHRQIIRGQIRRWLKNMAELEKTNEAMSSDQLLKKASISYPAWFTRMSILMWRTRHATPPSLVVMVPALMMLSSGVIASSF
ncbi:unnamed protein product, partial [Chrysoparadoxa australica]